jgi:hypothetical protein
MVVLHVVVLALPVARFPPRWRATGGSARRRLPGRSFFGVHRVIETGDCRLLVHGTTIHGAQRNPHT